MFCTGCGKELQEGQKFCPQCGKALQSDNKKIRVEKPKKEKKEKVKNPGKPKAHRRILVIAACVVVLLGGGYWLWDNYGYNITANRETEINYQKSDEDIVWGISAFSPENDPKYQAAHEEAVAQYQHNVDAIALREQENEKSWLEEALYEGLVAGLEGLAGNVDSSAGTTYNDGCDHEWREAYYHQVCSSTKETTKTIDGYVLDENNYATCKHLACYECAKCGSVKSYTMGISGEYSDMGTYECSAHAGCAQGSMQRVNTL